MRSLLRLAGLIIFVFFVFSALCDAEEDQLLRDKSQNLSSLILSIEYISSEIREAQKILVSPEGLGREIILKTSIDELSRKLEDLNKNFDLLATGVRYETVPGNLQSGFNWNHELKVLIGPLIHEIQELTLRPREIEKLRSNIAFYKEHVRLANTAIENLNKLIKVSENSKNLRGRLQKSVKEWLNRRNEWESLNNIAVMHLELKSGDQSISKSIQDIPRIFFKSHGRNMSIALLVFILSCFGMFRFYGIIKKYSPIHAEERSFYGRLFDLSYIFCSTLLVIISTLAVFYLFSDWVLLSVSIIFIFGVVWASKQAFSRLWLQIRLILNFGPVRERELVVYKGLLYRVISINLYTTLYNPLIQAGLIKIPISDIMELRSRPIVKDEPWFPSKQGDWVLLADQSHCKIIAQTPEIVKVKLPGGAEMSYTTGEYIKLSPMNLSSGFRLVVAFGLDYIHQGEITTTIPDIFRDEILSQLSRFGYDSYFSNLYVYFKSAAQSSLDLEIIADCNETAGEYYYIFERFIQRTCVDICNKHKWLIPFMQMTVHMEQKS